MYIAVSDHTARELAAFTNVDPARIRVVPNAVDPRFRPADADASALSLVHPGVVLRGPQTTELAMAAE